MRYGISDFIFEQSISATTFDDLQCEHILAEGAVMGALMDSYIKQSNLLTYMQEDGIEDTSAFDIFSEGVFVEAGNASKKTKTGKGDGTKFEVVKNLGKRIKGWYLSAISAVKKLIDKLLNLFKGTFTAEGRLEKMLSDKNTKKIMISTKLLEGLNDQISRIDEYQKEFTERAMRLFTNSSIKERGDGNTVLGKNYANFFANINKQLENLIEKEFDDVQSVSIDEFKILWNEFKKSIEVCENRKKYLENLEDTIRHSQNNEDLDVKLSKEKDLQVGISAMIKLQQLTNKILIKVGTQAIKAQKKEDRKPTDNKDK